MRLRLLALVLPLVAGAAALLGRAPATLAEDRPQEADDVLALIGARAGEAIADVGCGRGTWTFMLAQAVGERGRVHAVDIDARVLEAVSARVEREKLGNVKVVHSSPDDPRLPKDALDVVFLNDVIDYVERPALAGFLAGIREALKADGRLVIRDPNGSPDRVIAECHRAGFALVEAIVPLRNAPVRTFAGGWYALKLRRAEPQAAVLPRLGEPTRHRTRVLLAEELFRLGVLTREELRGVWDALRTQDDGEGGPAAEARDLIQAGEALGLFGAEQAQALRGRVAR